MLKLEEMGENGAPTLLFLLSLIFLRQYEHKQAAFARPKYACTAGYIKTCSSFLNYVSSRSLDIALKVSSSERRRVVLLIESVQISPCGFICEREES